MKLQEVFDQLGDGEFSQMSIGGADAGVIDETNYAKVLGHVNLGLTALFTRFTLKQGRLVVQIQEDQTDYKLNSTFAVQSRRSREPVRYLLDTVDAPFLDDILKIEQVLTDKEVELALNDGANRYSVLTPNALQLRIPVEIASPGPLTPEDLFTDNLTVVYRANHPKVSVGVGYFDPARIELQLPDSHLTALLYFVASRVNNPVGMSNEFHAGNSYYKKYEMACAELETRGMQVDQGTQNTRAQRGGWV